MWLLIIIFHASNQAVLIHTNHIEGLTDASLALPICTSQSIVIKTLSQFFNTLSDPSHTIIWKNTCSTNLPLYPYIQHEYLQLAEKGELICDDSVSPSPAATPRQSMTEVESSKQTSDGTTPSPARNSSGQNQELKAKEEQPEPKANTKGSNSTPLPPSFPHPTLSGRCSASCMVHDQVDVCIHVSVLVPERALVWFPLETFSHSYMCTCISPQSDLSTIFCR